MNQIIRQQLHKVLIDGKYPTTNVKVKGILFEFIFTDKDIALCNNVIDCITFLSNVVKCTTYNNEVVPLTELPSVYLYPLQIAYYEFQYNILRTFFGAITEFVESAESKGLWLIYKHSDPSHVLSINGKLNLIQQRWIALNAMNDIKDNMTTITDIFEAAKPWLDKELFKQIEDYAKDAKDVRENAHFDNDSYDEELRKKAKQIFNNQQEDNTTIVMEDEEGEGNGG